GEPVRSTRDQAIPRSAHDGRTAGAIRVFGDGVLAIDSAGITGVRMKALAPGPAEVVTALRLVIFLVGVFTHVADVEHVRGRVDREAERIPESEIVDQFRVRVRIA